MSEDRWRPLCKPATPGDEEAYRVTYEYLCLRFHGAVAAVMAHEMVTGGGLQSGHPKPIGADGDGD